MRRDHHLANCQNVGTAKAKSLQYLQLLTAGSVNCHLVDVSASLQSLDPAIAMDRAHCTLPSLPQAGIVIETRPTCVTPPKLEIDFLQALVVPSSSNLEDSTLRMGHSHVDRRTATSRRSETTEDPAHRRRAAAKYTSHCSITAND